MAGHTVKSLTIAVSGDEPNTPRPGRSKALTIGLVDIDVSDRVQPLDEQKAQEIATSFSAHGQLINRIGLRHTPNGEKKWVLVHGRHRLRAMEIAGIVELIEGAHFDRLVIEPAQARLMEIEENMARTDVSPFGRAVMLVAYRDALGLDGRGGDRRSDDFKSRNFAAFEQLTGGFEAHAMRVFDLSDDKVDRLLKIGTVLTAPAGLSERLHFSKIARNQSQLLKLAALPPENLERAAAAFDAAQGDFYNLMAILNQAPARQVAMLKRLAAGAPVGEVVEDTRPVNPPAFDRHKQAIGAYGQMSHRHRASIVVEFFKIDQKALRAGLRSLGWDLVKVDPATEEVDR